jgi:hypothetical protein
MARGVGAERWRRTESNGCRGRGRPRRGGEGAVRNGRVRGRQRAAVKSSGGRVGGWDAARADSHDRRLRRADATVRCGRQP